MTDFDTAFDAALRQNFLTFAEKSFAELSPATIIQRNWHLEALAYHLEQVLSGEIRRLIVTLPPRNLKSMLCSVAFPAFILGRDPTRKIICVSHSYDLAYEFSRNCRDLMTSPFYRRAFPQTRLSRRVAEGEFQTTKHGGRFSTSINGGLTGRGGNFVIIDDPIKADDVYSDPIREQIIRWYRETLITRLDDKPNDRIIVVMQRLHVDDLAGYLLGTGEWVCLNLPAIAQRDEEIIIGPGRTHHRKEGDLLHPERETAAVLAQLAQDMGPKAFGAQYLQQPVPPDGTLLHWSWFELLDEMPKRRSEDEIVQSWDTANKAGLTNDYSVCTTWLVRDESYYLLDVFRARMEFPNLRRKVIEHANTQHADRVLIEDAASGQSLLQELKNRPAGATWYTVAIQHQADKAARAEAQSVAIESGRVFLPKTAPWLDAFRSEVQAFPRGAHDDQIDSVTQFLGWVRSRVKWATKLPNLLG